MRVVMKKTKISGYFIGACWQAEDIDEQVAYVWLKDIVDGQAVWHWQITKMNGQLHEGDRSTQESAWSMAYQYMTPGRGGKGDNPIPVRIANYYTGKEDA